MPRTTSSRHVFTHVTELPHPRDDVFAWHDRPGAFVRLSRPGAATLVTGPTDGIEVGSDVHLRIGDPTVAGLLPSVPLPDGRGPVGIPWHARHTELDRGRWFVDEQVSGPFRSWRHEHLFEDAPAADGRPGTRITDTVTFELPTPVPGFVVAQMMTYLGRQFTFRAEQLRDDLAFWAAHPVAPRRIGMTGAGGMIGGQVRALLGTGGHDVVALRRGRDWDPAAGTTEAAVFEGLDAVIHLAGAPIAGRFTAEHKREVLRSRVDGTATVARAVREHGVRHLVSGSAIGVYGARRPGEDLTEAAAPGGGFLAEVVAAWESAAAPAVDADARVAFARTSVVLSPAGGALPPQLALFRMGLGGRLTASDAGLSWISLDDEARALVHLALSDDVEGPVNLAAPTPSTAGEFARTLGRVLRRPALLPVPSFGPRLVLRGEGAEEIIETDQRVFPARLQASGFAWGQPDLEGALRHVVGRPRA